ncbi:hypothetical protein PBY51_019067 [Eleginops maclovinus]|uniref:Uncharacterized protein n=1 Tax=Eleginops maclovinus TaxID=56733 RepID=A0AAN7Y9E8_ELEMC|nr:hypothetical protein PBY51_019067 [Eleginops maclovinus]
MDEQAGLQEHQRTASVPPNPSTTPPNHQRQNWESARSTGRKAWAATPRLQLQRQRGKVKGIELVCSNRRVCLGEHQDVYQ